MKKCDSFLILAQKFTLFRMNGPILSADFGYLRVAIFDQCASVLTMLQYTTAPYMIQKRIVEYE